MQYYLRIGLHLSLRFQVCKTCGHEFASHKIHLPAIYISNAAEEDAVHDRSSKAKTICNQILDRLSKRWFKRSLGKKRAKDGRRSPAMIVQVPYCKFNDTMAQKNYH